MTINILKLLTFECQIKSYALKYILRHVLIFCHTLKKYALKHVYLIIFSTVLFNIHVQLTYFKCIKLQLY